MARDEYEVFEHLPDRTLGWCGIVHGIRGAQAAVWLRAEEASTECFAMHSGGTEIVIARTPVRGATRIFQVAYSTMLASRAHLLRHAGYDVTSVRGNGIAQLVLQVRPPYDLFVIGPGASQAVRTEMAGWLRGNYPRTRIVALNPCDHIIEGLRYNAPDEPATAWLPMVSAAVEESRVLGNGSQ